MEWNQFEEKKVDLPESTVNSLLEGFSKATKGLADLGIKKAANSRRLSSSLETLFQFEVILYSEFIPDYRMTVFKFGYDIEIYPVKLEVSDNIFEDVEDPNWPFTPKVEVFDSEELFKEKVEKIFKGEKFVEIVSGIMKIASTFLSK